MNFQDIVDKSNEQFEVLKHIENFISQVNAANSLGKETNNWLFTSCYRGSTNSIIVNTQERYKIFREKLIAIDGYELGVTISKMKNIYNNKMIDKALENIETSYRHIYGITKLLDVNDIINNFSPCLNYLDNILNEYKKIIILIQYVNELNTDLSKGIEQVPFRIRSFNEDITEESINCLIIPIKKIYEEFGYILGINTREEPCNIVRVESGTFEGGFDGNKIIYKIMEFFLPRLYDLFIERRTNRGRKLSLSESMDELLKENEVSKKLKENGIDTTEIDESIKKKMILISKQSEILFLAHPDIKINKQVIKRTEEMEKLLGKPVYKIEAKTDIDEIDVINDETATEQDNNDDIFVRRKSRDIQLK